MIGEGDFDSTLAYDCLHLFQWPPSAVSAMSREEKAFVCASIDMIYHAEGRAGQ